MIRHTPRSTAAHGSATGQRYYEGPKSRVFKPIGLQPACSGASSYKKRSARACADEVPPLEPQPNRPRIRVTGASNGAAAVRARRHRPVRARRRNHGSRSQGGEAGRQRRRQEEHTQCVGDQTEGPLGGALQHECGRPTEGLLPRIRKRPSATGCRERRSASNGAATTATSDRRRPGQHRSPASTNSLTGGDGPMGGPGSARHGCSAAAVARRHAAALDFARSKRGNPERTPAREVINHCATKARTTQSGHPRVGAAAVNAFPELTNEAGRGARLTGQVRWRVPAWAAEVWCNEPGRYVLAIAPAALTLFQAFCERDTLPVCGGGCGHRTAAGWRCGIGAARGARDEDKARPSTGNERDDGQPPRGGPIAMGAACSPVRALELTGVNCRTQVSAGTPTWLQALYRQHRRPQGGGLRTAADGRGLEVKFRCAVSWPTARLCRRGHELRARRCGDRAPGSGACRGRGHQNLLARRRMPRVKLWQTDGRLREPAERRYEPPPPPPPVRTVGWNVSGAGSRSTGGKTAFDAQAVDARREAARSSPQHDRHCFCHNGRRAATLTHATRRDAETRWCEVDGAEAGTHGRLKMARARPDRTRGPNWMKRPTVRMVDAVNACGAERYWPTRRSDGGLFAAAGEMALPGRWRARRAPGRRRRHQRQPAEPGDARTGRAR